MLRNGSLPREKRIAFEKIIHSPVKTVLKEGGENVLKEIVALGRIIPEEYKDPLRDIHKIVTKL